MVDPIYARLKPATLSPPLSASSTSMPNHERLRGVIELLTRPLPLVPLDELSLTFRLARCES